MSIKSSWFIVLVKSYISLFIFFLLFLPIIESGILKSSTIIFELSASLFNYVSSCLMYFRALVLEAYFSYSVQPIMLLLRGFSLGHAVTMFPYTPKITVVLSELFNCVFP